MDRGHSILEDLMAEYEITIPETATRADTLGALNALTEALEAERIPASRDGAEDPTR
jgi:hypothetical protein